MRFNLAILVALVFLGGGWGGGDFLVIYEGCEQLEVDVGAVSRMSYSDRSSFGVGRPTARCSMENQVLDWL